MERHAFSVKRNNLIKRVLVASAFWQRKCPRLFSGLSGAQVVLVEELVVSELVTELVTEIVTELVDEPVLEVVTEVFTKLV